MTTTHLQTLTGPKSTDTTQLNPPKQITSFIVAQPQSHTLPSETHPAKTADTIPLITRGKRLPRLRQSHSDNEGLPEKEATAEDAVEKTAEAAKVVQDNKTKSMISQLDTIRTQPKTRPVQTYSKKPVPRYTQKQDS